MATGINVEHLWGCWIPGSWLPLVICRNWKTHSLWDPPPGVSESVGEEGFSKVRKGVFLKFSKFGNHCFREKWKIRFKISPTTHRPDILFRSCCNFFFFNFLPWCRKRAYLYTKTMTFDLFRGCYLMWLPEGLFTACFQVFYMGRFTPKAPYKIFPFLFAFISNAIFCFITSWAISMSC